MARISTEYITSMAVKNTTTKQVKYFFLFYYFCLLFYMIRATFAALMFNQMISFISTKLYLEFESIINYGYRMGIIDRYFITVICPVYFSLFFVDYIVHFQPKSGPRYCCQLVYDLMVVNRDNFYLLNPKLNLKDIFCKYILNRQNTLANVTPQLLKHFPELEPSIQQKAVLITICFDLFATFSYLFMAFLNVTFVCYLYVFTVWPVYFFARGFFTFLDITFFTYTIFHTFKISFFLCHFFNLLLYVLSSQLKLAMDNLDTHLKKVFKTRKRKNLLRKKKNLSTFLNITYLPLYNCVLYSLDKTNNELVSRGLLIALLTFFGFNVYSVSMVTLVKLRSEAMFIIYTVNGVSIFFIFFMFGPMIRVEKRMRISRQRLFQTQTYLSSFGFNGLRLHLKINSTNQLVFAFTVGPVGELTSKSVFNVIC